MPLVRIIRDGIFIEEDKRCDTDDTPDVSEETAKLLYSRNWAVPYFKEDDFVVENETESNEVESFAKAIESAEQNEESEIDLKPAPRRR